MARTRASLPDAAMVRTALRTFGTSETEVQPQRVVKLVHETRWNPTDTGVHALHIDRSHLLGLRLGVSR